MNILKKNKYIKNSIKLFATILLKPFSLMTAYRISKRDEIFLEIGSGEKKGTNGWFTLDSCFFVDINWDLRHGIPFPDNSIDKIYTSHTFEHIPFDSLQKLIRICHRKLKRGGTLSVCVPNARLYIDAYISGEKFIDLYDENKVCPLTRCDTGSPIDQVNLIAYLGGQHCYMFDKTNLVNILRMNGFSEVKERSFQADLDRIERDGESIYALATK